MMTSTDLGQVGVHSPAQPNMFSVDSVTVHPEYNNNIDEPKWDFVLLHVTTPVPPNIAKPIPLNVDPHFLTTTQESTMLTTMGFGATYEGSPNWSETLQEVTTAYIPSSSCQMAYLNNLTEAEICVGNYAEGGKDACQGNEIPNVL
jgi:Trypsin